MAEEAKKQDFIKFHTMPVEEWESTTGGKDYIKYLEKAEARNEVNKLSSEEKNDLARLTAYKQGKNGPDDEEAYDYDESSIDWSRINEPTKVVFYLVWPSFMLSNPNKNIQGYVKTQWKSKGELGIAKEARKKLEAITGANDKQNQNEQDSEEKQENEEIERKEDGKKPTLWVRFARYAKKSNGKSDLYDLAVLNSEELANEGHEKKQSNPTQVQTQKKDDVPENLESAESGLDA